MTGARAELKGNILRGYLRWLEEAGLLARVRAAAPATLGAVLDEPPLPNAWIPAAETTLPLVEAVAKVTDLRTVRRMSRQAASGPILALLRPLVEGVLRLAMGPAGVVKRLPLLLGSSARHITFEVEPCGEREARLVMRTSGVRETRPSAEAWVGAIEAVLLLAGAEPRVDVVAIEPDDRESRVVISLGW